MRARGGECDAFVLIRGMKTRIENQPLTAFISTQYHHFIANSLTPTMLSTVSSTACMSHALRPSPIIHCCAPPG